MKKILNKYLNMPVQVKAVFWLTVCTLLQKGISIITVPIFTRIMSTDDYGIFSKFISWENIIQLFTTLSLHTGVFNTAMIKNEDRHNVVVSSYLGLSTLITSVTFLIYLMLQNGINKAMGLSTGEMLFMFLNLLLSPAFNLWIAQQRFEYKYVKLVVYTLMYSLISPIICYFAVIYAEDAAYARIAASSLVSALFYSIIYIAVFFKGRVFFDANLWKNAIIVNVPLIPHFLSASILNQADRLMISGMIGNSEAGIYSVGYSAAMLLQIVIGSVNASIVPWLYNKIKRNRAGETKALLNVASILMFGAVIVFMLFAPECMRILAPIEYRDAIWIFPPLTSSVFFIYVYNLYCNIELYYEKSLYITISSCLAALLNIVLNYLLIPLVGYTVAGYTTLISYISYAAIHCLFAKKIVKEHQIDNPIDNRFIAILFGILLIMTILINSLYRFLIIRYVIFFLIFLLAIIYRKNIMESVKEVKRK